MALIIKKNKRFYLNIRNWITAAYSFLFLSLFRIFPIKKTKVLFVSYYGKGFGDSGKYIANELLRDSSKKTIIWAAREQYKASVPEGVRYVKYFSPKYFYHLATAKVWVNNARFVFGTIKRKKQFYLHTWHSSLRLKKIEKDAGAILGKDYIRTAKNDSKMINLIISGNRFSTNIYKNSFWYDGEVLETGVPRCDVFLQKERIREASEKIYKKYNIKKGEKILLYAPTFRKNQDESGAYIDCSKVASQLGGKYRVFVRMHPNSRYSFPKSKNVTDVTHYSDMQELICAADILVTDYSGCCFDMMIKGGACIICAKDMKEYLAKERDLYFDYEKDLPFPITTSEEELVNKIKNFDYNKYSKDVEKFNKKIGLCEKGTASEAVSKIILEQING